MLTVLSIAGLASAVIAATSERERMRIIGEFAASAGIGLLLSRVLGATPAALIFLPPDNYEDDQRRRREQELEQAWRRYVEELAPVLVEHLIQYQRFLWDCERELEWIERNHLSLSIRPGIVGRILADLLADGEAALVLVVADVRSVTRRYLPLLREKVLAHRGVLEEELIAEIVR